MGGFELSLPIVVLAAAAVALMVGFQRAVRDRLPAARIAAGALAAAAVLIAARGAGGPADRAFDGFILGDGVAVVAGSLACLAGAVTALFLGDYLRRLGANHPEFHVLVLLGTAGMLVMVGSDHLVTIFLGLEVMSLALYVLSGSLRRRPASVEAGTKYFLTGAFASSILLFGAALLYGATGSLSIPAMAAAPPSEPALALAGSLLLLVGFAFKLGVVPFHQWAPDVYEGAPTPITGFMATAVKLVAFSALLRVVEGLPEVAGSLVTPLAWLAVLTMTVGNVAALAQTSVKRMLAYSSISHAGYVMIGVVVTAAGGAGREAVLFYLAGYVVMNLGAFGVLAVLEDREGRGVGFDDLGGLKNRHPVLAASMLVFMLSLAGIPPTAGFLGKWRLFEALAEVLGSGAAASPDHRPLFVLLLVGLVVNSVIGLAYYLRVIVSMYMVREGAARAPGAPVRPLVAAGILLCGALVLWLGFGPTVLGVGAESFVAWVRGAAG